MLPLVLKINGIQMGYKNAIEYSIDENETIKILSPEHFLATKLEAFKNRGYSDPRQSQDFEDIVYILEEETRYGRNLQIVLSL